MEGGGGEGGVECAAGKAHPPPSTIHARIVKLHKFISHNLCID